MFGVPPSVLPEQAIASPVLVIYVAEPGLSDAQLAAMNAARTQYEEWRTAKNDALRGFLGSKAKDNTLVTISSPGFVHATFMDIRLLGNPSTEDAANHRTGVQITFMFFDQALRWGDQKAWQKFASSPGLGISVESLSERRDLKR